MKVINRKNETENISFDKISGRITSLVNYTNHECILEPLDNINVIQITLDTILKLYDGISTKELDIESAKVCANKALIHYNYSILGGRILLSNLYKNLKKLELTTFSSRVIYLHNNLPNYYNVNYIKFVLDNKDSLNNFIKPDRDYLITYFGFKTLEKSYLMKINDNIIETPQDYNISKLCDFYKVEHQSTENLTIDTYNNFITGKSQCLEIITK